jgi:hypothetical protein
LFAKIIWAIISFIYHHYITSFRVLFHFFLRQIIIDLTQNIAICGNCFRISQPFSSAYSNGIRYCEHCGSSNFLRNIRKVIGVIGGDIEMYEIIGDKVYINLWDNEQKVARNADINVLEIKETSKAIDYDLAIESVINTLYNDVLRSRDYLRSIKVFIDKKISLSDNIMNFLRRNFGDIIYVENR